MADPIEDAIVNPMNVLAHMVDEALNGPKQPGIKPKYGFIVLAAEFGKMDGGRVNYISNGEREDMIAMLREYLARVEGRVAESSTRQ